jgi:hypothetical protein
MVEPVADRPASLAAPFAEPGLPALLREPSPARAVFERNCLTCATGCRSSPGSG